MRALRRILLPMSAILIGLASCGPNAPSGMGATATPLHATTTTQASSVVPTASASATRTPVPPVDTLVPPYVPTLPHGDIHFIRNGSRDRPFIALTFDICQKPALPAGFDRDIVNVLVRYDVPATFFMGGDWMRTHPSETQELAAIPLFELGNHSWSHPDFEGLDEAALTQEIMKAQQMLYDLSGRQARLFRLPAGKYDALALIMIAWHGLYTIQWDADSADPVGDNDAGMMSGLVEERVANGSIVLFHANGRGWHTAEALPIIIENLRAEGFSFVTVSQLIGLEPLPDGSWAAEPESMLP
jgi:peptidoglycan/xylan/chitin deacetylase (PgdA/CDA1 family)